MYNISGGELLVGSIDDITPSTFFFILFFSFSLFILFNCFTYFLYQWRQKYFYCSLINFLVPSPLQFGYFSFSSDLYYNVLFCSQSQKGIRLSSFALIVLVEMPLLLICKYLWIVLFHFILLAVIEYLFNIEVWQCVIKYMCSKTCEAIKTILVYCYSVQLFLFFT